uniref:Uncharacterized protein n=1 Tax=Anguilla anguilla TaxID=7936 RepID=A0A0E9SYR0_ANGAN
MYPLKWYDLAFPREYAVHWCETLLNQPKETLGKNCKSHF